MTAPQQPDPQQVQALVAALAAYQAASTALRASLTGYIQRLWASLGQYRQREMKDFIGQVVPVVAGAQRQMLSLTAASLAQQQQIALGGKLTPAAVDPKNVTGGSARNGVSPADVYERPFHLVWRQLHDLPREDGSIEKAISQGLDRAIEIAVTDVQLTKQRTALQAIGSDDQVVGYRRVLEGAHSCGLCIVAATNRYHKRELMPIHPVCDCSVAPIYGTADPGQNLTAMVNVDGKLMHIADLADVHDRIEQRFGKSSAAAGIIPGAKDSRGRIVQYRDILITHAHGELGPLLGVRGESFTHLHAA